MRIARLLAGALQSHGTLLKVMHRNKFMQLMQSALYPSHLIITCDEQALALRSSVLCSFSNDEVFLLLAAFLN